MSSVLYYSKYCKNCSSIIGKLSKTSIQKDIHFVCVDKRVRKEGKIYLMLDGGKQVLLPETVHKVPAIFAIVSRLSCIVWKRHHELLSAKDQRRNRNCYTK